MSINFFLNSSFNSITATGGGRGGNTSTNTGVSGATNTGGGAGSGNYNNGGYAGGNGGSGVVIFRYADSYPAASTTGSPTVTSASGYRYYKFNSSGSITF